MGGWPQNRWEVGLRNRWEVGLRNRWEAGLVGSGLSKLVVGGRMAPKTGRKWEVIPGGRWDVETPATLSPQYRNPASPRLTSFLELRLYPLEVATRVLERYIRHRYHWPFTTYSHNIPVHGSRHTDAHMRRVRVA